MRKPKTERNASIVAAFRDGATPSEIAARHGISRQFVARVLKRSSQDYLGLSHYFVHGLPGYPKPIPPDVPMDEDTTSYNAFAFSHLD